tara:strand:- start:15936 stop:16520 length:585 start_codon:yes stop_codon:yes gene_type:complete
MTNFWKNIWDTKGNSDSTDLLFLDGYEHLNIEFNSKELCDKIASLGEFQYGEKILEVGCGCGFLARELQVHYAYTGVDYSEPIINKHKELFPTHCITVADSNSLPFEDNSFDRVFCFGLFQYLPNEAHALQTIQEMQRVSRNTVFLGDLKESTTREEHFVFPKEKLDQQGFRMSNCLYDATDVERYNAVYGGIK